MILIDGARFSKGRWIDWLIDWLMMMMMIKPEKENPSPNSENKKSESPQKESTEYPQKKQLVVTIFQLFRCVQCANDQQMVIASDLPLLYSWKENRE